MVQPAMGSRELAACDDHTDAMGYTSKTSCGTRPRRRHGTLLGRRVGQSMHHHDCRCPTCVANDARRVAHEPERRSASNTSEQH